MPQQHTEIDWDQVLIAAGPYPMEALHFVREGLSYTVHRVHENPERMEPFDRHVSGRELCMGLRDFAIHQYGMMAAVVLQHWKIQRTDDFGRLVFAMIDAGVMSKTPDDCVEDFRDVYDFGEAFNPRDLRQLIGHTEE